MRKDTREHLIQYTRVIKDPIILNKIQEFIETDCIIGRAAILKNIKETSDYTYDELSMELFENKRQLIRIIKLNNLIKELKILAEKRLISKVVSYEISSFSIEKQEEYYQLILKTVKQKKNSKRKAFQHAEYLAIKESENNAFL